ncbi:hypothetical protein [Vibrio rhizosphaerae]|uniref:hypothetical protein n=1 Tax=Vibrio rhizosphaerae TaxID=398736 RepID=UPI000570E190|nr:hypothetical protein [Vibrio rhizosphaerae]
MNLNRKKNNSLLKSKTLLKSGQRLLAKSCFLFLIGFSYSAIENNAHAFGLGDVVKVGGDLVDSAMKKQDEKEKKEQEQKQKILQDARNYADPILKRYKHVSGYHGIKISHDTQTLYSDLKYVYSGDDADKIRQAAKKLDENLSPYQSQINRIEQQKKAQKEKERQQRLAAEKKRQEEMQKQAAAEKAATTPQKKPISDIERESQERLKRFNEESAKRQAHDEEMRKQRELKLIQDAERQQAEQERQQAEQDKENEKNRQYFITELKKRRIFDDKLSKYSELYPLSQLQLAVASYSGRMEYKKATSELARGATRGQRKSLLCGLQGKHYDWIGKVTELTTNSEGKGVLAVKFGEHMYLTTANNVFSDIGVNSLLDPSSEIFQSALTLSRGDIIRFDGYLFSSQNDCVREFSATLRGSMTEPNYLFKFIHVEKIN